jgi:hypothetical protein
MQWRKIFLPYTDLKGCSEIIEGTQEAPDAEDILDEEKDKTKLRLVIATAFALLNSSAKYPVSFRAISNGKITKPPKGVARKDWQNLEAIFEYTS